jgi:hypothetical protein
MRAAGTPSRKRLAAVFSSERNVSELEVYDGTGKWSKPYIVTVEMLNSEC